MNNSVVVSSLICFATAVIVAIAMNNTEPINQKKTEKNTEIYVVRQCAYIHKSEQRFFYYFQSRVTSYVYILLILGVQMYLQKNTKIPPYPNLISFSKQYINPTRQRPKRRSLLPLCMQQI